MEIQIALLAAVVGYLLGSISFARLVMKLVAPGEELSGMELDSGAEETVHVEHVGGTSIGMKLGSKYGGITAILDILKVAIPTLIFKILYPEAPYYLITATTGLVGHNWPLYHRFKGGSGLSAMYGGFLVVDWIGVLVTAVAGMFLGLVVLRNVVLSFLLGPWLMIPWVWFRTHDLAQVAYVSVANVLFLLAMIPQIRMIIDRKRRGLPSDFEAASESMPMGRMIKKMGTRLRLFQDD